MQIRARLSERFPALLALAIPTLSGLAYLTVQNAPQHYVIVNAAALCAASLWIIVGTAPTTKKPSLALICAFLALLYLPLISGTNANGVARWLPAGPFLLNSGMLAFPALAVLANANRAIAPFIFCTALLAAFLQPDAALGFAILFAAAGLHDVTKDWRLGATAILAFVASLSMALRGELPPQAFVERVIADLALQAPLIAAALLAAWVATIVMIARFIPLERGARYALGGALFGFVTMAILSHYPSLLIGYGASPILGFGLALGLHRTGDA